MKFQGNFTKINRASEGFLKVEKYIWIMFWGCIKDRNQMLVTWYRTFCHQQKYACGWNSKNTRNLAGFPCRLLNIQCWHLWDLLYNTYPVASTPQGLCWIDQYFLHLCFHPSYWCWNFEAILGSKKLRKEFAQPNGWGDKHTLKISKLFKKFLEVVKYLQKKNSQYLYKFLQYLQTV